MAEKKILVWQDQITRAIGLVAKVVPSNPQIPILETILMKFKDGKLEVTANNFEVAISTLISIEECKEDATFAVPAKMFQELINTFSESKPIEMYYDEDSLTLRIESANSKHKIKCIPPFDYPEIPDLSECSNEVSLPTAQLRKGILRTAIATLSNAEEANSQFTAILIRYIEDKLVLIGLDRFRMSKCSFDLGKKLPYPINFLIPAKFLTEVARVCTSDSTKVYTHKSEKAIFVSGESKVMCSVMDTSRFPDTERLPTPNGKVAFSGQVIELVKSARRTAIFVDAKNTFNVEINPMSLILSAATNTGSGSSTILGSGFGDIKFKMSAKYIQEVISIIDTPEFVIQIDSPESPIFVMPKNDETFYHMIMPVV